MSQIHPIQWVRGQHTRVPYAVYQNQDVLEQEQKRVYEGPTWNYLCLEAELPEPGNYRTTFVGRAPVIVARDTDGRWWVVELNDGQRSGMSANDPTRVWTRLVETVTGS